MDLQIIATIVGIIVAVLGVLAVSVTYVGGSRQKAAITALESTVHTLETSRDTFKDELEIERGKNETLTTKVAALETQVETLLEQRPSQELITEMARDLNIHHRETSLILNSIHDAVVNSNE